MLGTMDAHDPLIPALRHATSARLTVLDALLGPQCTLDPGRYERVLQALEAFLSVWEPAVKVALPPYLQPWFQERSRSQLARRDLEILDVMPVPSCLASRVEIATVAEAFGSLFVMESATQGAPDVAKALLQKHGVNAASGGAYFHAFGRFTCAMWRDYEQLVESWARDGLDRGQAIDAAIRTFDALEETFRTVCDEPISA